VALTSDMRDMSQRLHLNGLDLRLETTSFEFTLSTRRFIRREFRRLRFRRYEQITLNAPHCVFSRMACDADEDEGYWVCWCCIRFLAPAWHGDGFYQIGSFLTASSSLRPSVNNHARGVVFKQASQLVRFSVPVPRRTICDNDSCAEDTDCRGESSWSRSISAQSPTNTSGVPATTSPPLSPF